MEKIRQLKESHEKTKLRNKLLEAEDMKMKLQMEILVKRVNDIDSKKNEFKQELYNTKKQNIKLAKQKRQIEMELDDISEQIEKGDIAGLLR